MRLEGPPRQHEKDGEMKSLYNRVRDFLRQEDGPTATEYAVMLALIILVCFAAITTLGNNVNATFEEATTMLS